MCLLLLCVTVMFCKFRFGLVESGKKEESLKDVLPLGEQMAPQVGKLTVFFTHRVAGL